MPRRTYSEDLKYIRRVGDTKFEIMKGFVPNMLVPGYFYVNSALEPLMFEELQASSEGDGVGGFLPAVSQIANVASLPGIVGASVGLPDTHSGYGFAIGNVAAFDMDDPQAVVSPGGVGFDINCVCEGALVNLSDGSSLPIEDVQPGASVLSADGKGGLVPRVVTARLDRGLRNCIELTFLDGRTVSLTSDHRLLRADGEWVTAGQLRVDEAVAVGVEYPHIDRGEDGGDWELDLTASLGFRLNMADRRAQAIAFCRVLGFCMTDGCVRQSRSGIDGKISLGHQLDVASMRADLRLLTSHHATVVMEGSTFALQLPARLTAAFASVGVDVGARFDRLVHLPAFVCAAACPAPLVRAFVSGCFGTNGRTLAVGHLSDGRCQLRTIGFSLRRAGAIAAAQLQLLRLELGGLLHRCDIAASDCSWFTDAAVTSAEVGRTEGQRRLTAGQALGRRLIVDDAEPVSAEHRPVQIKVELNSEATIAFAQSCCFAHCCNKQLRLSAGVTVLRAMATGSLTEKVARGKRALSETQSLFPQVEAWSPRLPADTCGTKRGKAGALTISDVLAAVDVHALLGVRRSQLKIAALPAAEEEVGDKEDSGARVAHAVPRDRNSLPLFRLPLIAKRAVGLKRVFDLVIDPLTPSFTANGVVVHNCGVRLIRTSLQLQDVLPVQERLTQALFDHIPVGVGSKGVIPTRQSDLLDALQLGIDWSVREGYAWVEDKEHIEEYGRMLDADVGAVSGRARQRGLPQLGTLGAGNHYAEVQVVEEVYDEYAARCMGIEQVGQVCVMIHSGSRGLGHQVATDALVDMEAAMAKQRLKLNDRQLACARIHSAEGSKYLKAMAAAANYAFVNRSAMTYLVRQAFASVFQQSADELDMRLVYDVSHNIAKQETHWHEGRERRLLVHRKGATRAFPAHHPLVPVDYQLCGQPVLIGGSMGTCSYVLTGTELGMKETWGSTCHGAGRAMSRNRSRRQLGWEEVHARLRDSGISIRMASPKLITEEAPESYKDVTEVVNTCHQAGISKKTVKLRPIAVVKG